MKDLLETLSQIKIIPVIKLDLEQDAVPLASALIKGGIPAAEITFRTPCAAAAIAAVAAAYPTMLVGAGTVLTSAQADAAMAAGAKFLVSPGFNPRTVQHCQDKGYPILPGCTTAGEVERAIEMGLSTLKFFPAEQSGGLAKIKALSAPFGHIRWMPTGGISMANLKSYLAFPKIIACGGSFMVSDEDIKAGNWDKITAACRKTVQLINGQPMGESIPSAPLFAKTDKAYDLITMGEVLIRMVAPNAERISDCNSFTRYVGGSEMNVAAGAAQLGLKTAMLTRLPQNDIGKYALHDLRSMGISDKLISYDTGKSARLGTYYFEKGVAPRKPKVVYDRANSSISSMTLDGLPQDIYSSTRVFHTSGITLALEAVRKAAIDAMRRFKQGGALISMDVNYRAALWDEETAKDIITSVLPLVDILFVSEETSRRMLGKTGTLQDIMRSYAKEYGTQLVATTARKVISASVHGWSSTIYITHTDCFYSEPPYDNIEVVDRIGSGDAFVSGALFGLLQQGMPEDMVTYGNAMAVLKCTIAGDLPAVDRDEAESLIAQRKSGDQSEMNR